MLQAQGSALVQGSVTPKGVVRVRVLRAFLLGGQRQEVGAVVAVPHWLADELRHQRRAETVADAPPPAADPPAEPPAAAPPARIPARARTTRPAT